MEFSKFSFRFTTKSKHFIDHVTGLVERKSQKGLIKFIQVIYIRTQYKNPEHSASELRLNIFYNYWINNRTPK
jgi:hypothetical protein